MKNPFKKKYSEFENLLKPRFLDNPFRLSEKIVTFWEKAMKELFHKHFSEGKKVLLLAVGGFGRRDMDLYSDPDITFIIGEDVLERIEGFFYELWDCDVQVSYSTRSLEETESVMDEDERTRFSLFEGRFLAGDLNLYESFKKIILNQIYSREAEVLKRIEGIRVSRHHRYRDTVYFIEPNVKEGIGGLRDIHSILWAIKVAFRKEGLDEGVRAGVITGREKREIKKRWGFLKRIRNILHYIHGRKYDILDFESQDTISRFLNIRGKDEPPEILMRKYFETTSYVKNATDYIIREIMNIKLGDVLNGKFRNVSEFYRAGRDRLVVKNERIFEKEPWRTIEIFKLSSELNLNVGESVRRYIRRMAKERIVAGLLQKDKRAVEEFLKIMRHDNGWFALLQMNETELLSTLIPAFRKIYHKVQRDMYHLYTVDVHSIFAVKEFGEIRKGALAEELPFPTEIAKSMERPELLSIALLFHDIGKGKSGPHADEGAKIVRRFLESIGLKKEAKVVANVVKLHTSFTEYPMKRDIRDHKFIVEFSEKVKKPEILDMLFIHAICDLRAVNPEAWTDWKYSTMLEFYESVKEALTVGDFYLYKQKKKIAEVKKKVMARVGNIRNWTELLEGFDEEYFLVFSPEEIVKHLELIREAQRKGYAFMKSDFPEKGYAEITVTARDEHGIFSRLCGAFTKAGLNILSALIFSRKDGRILDVFRVTERGTLAFPYFFDWDKLWNNLHIVLREGRDVGEVEKELKMRVVRDRVILNNNISRKYTVVEVTTTDRVGLLYHITSTLSSLNCEIHTAKVLTLGKIVSDVFYITDDKGKKIEDSEKLGEIKAKLLESLRK